ncbi:MAG: aminotransferase class V-fold PLP-dependent enzyme [Alphaproteobacteria bacterium]|nr:MAG: aminotransferase class V-fold PLP-dependent enzyme [Alphaproteobacteria bacterium]
MPGFEVIDEEEKKAISRIFDEGKVFFAHGFDNKRKHYHVREFENKLKTVFSPQMADALCVSSGTAAIKVALKALGIGKGDNVITQSFNFIATVEAIVDTGASVIFTDIDDTLNMSPMSLESLITKKTKAIIPVHMLGVPADMISINKIGKRFKIPIIEDACEAIGAKVAKKYVGGLSEFGVFSFDFGKMITTGEGGALFSKKKNDGKIARMYHDHGHKNIPDLPRGLDRAGLIGFNYRMTEISGAFGKVQLGKFSGILKESKKRYLTLERYISHNQIKLRHVNLGNEPNYDTFVISIENKKLRDRVISLLNQTGFGTKNLPDAFNWHCAYFWKHINKKIRNKEVTNCYKRLLRCVAIPILVSKPIIDYKNIASYINELS